MPTDAEVVELRRLVRDLQTQLVTLKKVVEALTARVATLEAAP